MPPSPDEYPEWLDRLDDLIEHGPTFFTEDMLRAMRGPESFFAWLEMGVRLGFCGEPSCGQHDGIEMTHVEHLEMEDGYDPCLFVIRLWGPDGPPIEPPPPWANAHMN